MPIPAAIRRAVTYSTPTPHRSPYRDLNRSDGAGAEDHFAFGADFEGFAISGIMHACGPAIPGEKLLDQDIRFQTQVLAVQNGFEKASGGRPAQAILLIDVKIAHALVMARVEVWVILWESPFPRPQR